MKREITITRNTKNFGWGFCSWTPEQPEPPSRPNHTGTVRQVFEAIKSDRTYQSFLSGGTYHSTAWFVKLNGAWKRIKFDGYGPGPVDLLTKIKNEDGFGSYEEYLYHSITGTVEIDDAAAALGSRNRGKTSEARARASAENGKLGGRPKHQD